MRFVYWEQGKELSTMFKLPDTLSTLAEAKEYVMAYWADVYAFDRIDPDYYGVWADICGEDGKRLSELYRTDDYSWYWKDVKVVR